MFRVHLGKSLRVRRTFRRSRSTCAAFAAAEANNHREDSILQTAAVEAVATTRMARSAAVPTHHTALVHTALVHTALGRELAETPASAARKVTTRRV